MTTTTFLETIELTHCWSCGMTFGLTADFIKRRRDDGDKFFCPQGHGIVYGQSEIDRLTKRLAAEERARLAAQQDRDHAWSKNSELNNRLRAQRGVVTRIKHRLGNGVCPCCQRTFQNLQRHMKTKHRDWSEEKK